MYWKRNSKGKIKKIEGKGPRKLNKLLETLYAEVKDKNWDDFEPDSLRVMMAALDRQLNEQGYKFFIIREREFHSSKQILEIKPSSMQAASSIWYWNIATLWKPLCGNWPRSKVRNFTKRNYGNPSTEKKRILAHQINCGSGSLR